MKYSVVVSVGKFFGHPSKKQDKLNDTEGNNGGSGEKFDGAMFLS